MLGIVLDLPQVVVYAKQHDQYFGIDAGHDRSEDDDQNTALCFTN
jgi:hypothetical protein